MILRSNITKLQDTCRNLPNVLDVGGWHNPFNLATHVLDIMPYQSRRTHEALDPEDGERFSEETWLVYDACAGDWPWPDDYFDFSICSHTLEDVRDPIVITSELARVSKAGYIEVPSWAREIFIKDRFWRLRMVAGRSPEIGFPHHRWLCELNDGELHFYQKDPISVSTAETIFLDPIWDGRNWPRTKQVSASSGPIPLPPVKSLLRLTHCLRKSGHRFFSN